jgi:pectin methylesterase-like acyl-CoA thioesterase
LNGVPFNGLSNVRTVATWSFTTRAAPTLVATNITVDGAQTSTANFRTVGGALGAIPAGTTNATINIAAGTYNELVHYTGPGAATPLTVNIVGPIGNTRGDNCVIQYANGNTRNGTTQTRASFYLANANFVLQNITVKNTAVRAQLAQAESLYFNGPGFTLAANNSSFFSNQDTIQTSGRSWFYNCYVEGNVDFIWGTGDAALFENCNLRFVNDVGAATSYSLFVARTGTTIAAGGNGTVGKGYVLLNSGVTVDANVTAFFGRDAGVGSFYDQAALIGVTFTGAGTIGAGIWNVTTAPLILGDPSIVGWKSAGCSGLNLGALTTAPNTAAVVNSQTAEYDTRDHILNRVVVVTSGAPAGFQAAAVAWDVSSLATAFNAPP